MALTIYHSWLSDVQWGHLMTHDMCGLFSSCIFLGERWCFPRMTTLEPIYKWRMFLFYVYALEGAVNILYPCCNIVTCSYGIIDCHSNIYNYYIYILYYYYGHHTKALNKCINKDTRTCISISMSISISIYVCM